MAITKINQVRLINEGDQYGSPSGPISDGYSLDKKWSVPRFISKNHIAG